MKAAVYDNPGPPTVLRYADVPDPVCGPDDVLIAVEAISIEGGDLINRRSTPQQSPWIVGYAAAGTVISVGKNVRDRAVGERVAAFDMQGSHAELWSVPASRTWLLPEGVGMAQAAALPISFGTAQHCLITKGGLQKAETVLIQAAAGGVGLAAVQLARDAGATVIAAAGGSERQARLRGLGASHVIDRLEKDVVEEVLRLTGGMGLTSSSILSVRLCKRPYPLSRPRVASCSSGMQVAAASMPISGRRCRTIKRCTVSSWGRSSRGRRYTELSSSFSRPWPRDAWRS